MEQHNILAEQTQEWIASLNAVNIEEIGKAKIENLRSVLRFNEYRYYVLNDAIISDKQYDDLYKLLEKVEKTILN